LLAITAERRLAPETTMYVACCHDERNAAIRDRITQAERIRVIHSGVTLDEPALPAPRQLTDLRTAGPVFGFLTGLREQKGLPTLLDAIEELVRQRSDARFAIVGNGPLRQYVDDRVRGSGLSGHVTVLPFELPASCYLHGFDAFVHPPYWEGFPLAVLEAMMAGLPVVASGVNGVPEAIEDGVQGFIVQPRDPQGLAAAIQRLAGDPPLRRRMGAAARATARERFTQDRMVDAIEDLYAEVSARTNAER